MLRGKAHTVRKEMMAVVPNSWRVGLEPIHPDAYPRQYKLRAEPNDGESWLSITAAELGGRVHYHGHAWPLRVVDSFNQINRFHTIEAAYAELVRKLKQHYALLNYMRSNLV